MSVAGEGEGAPGEPGLRCGGAGGRTARVGSWGFKVLREGNSGEAAGNTPLHHP